MCDVEGIGVEHNRSLLTGVFNQLLNIGLIKKKKKGQVQLISLEFVCVKEDWAFHIPSALCGRGAEVWLGWGGRWSILSLSEQENMEVFMQDSDCDVNSNGKALQVERKIF